MLFYTIFIILLFIFFRNNTIGKKQKRNYSFLIGTILVVCVLAFRFDVGVDYSTYYEDFERAIRKHEAIHFEPLNQILFSIGAVFESPSITIALYGILTPVIALFAIKHLSENYFIGVLTYICIFYLYSFSIMRQAIAMSILLYGYKYLSHNELCKYILIVIISGLFHYSAFIALFFPFIYRYCSSRILFIILISLSIIVHWGLGLISQIPLIGKYAIYFDVINEMEGGFFQRLFMWCLLGILWIVKILKKGQTNHLLILCTCGIIFPILLGPHIGGRIAQYFYVYLCFCAPQILKTKALPFKTLYICSILCWYFSYIYIAEDNDSRTFIPYHTIFEENSIPANFK